MEQADENVRSTTPVVTKNVLVAQVTLDDDFEDLAEEFTVGIRSDDPEVFDKTIQGYQRRHFRHVPRRKIFAAIQPLLSPLAPAGRQPQQAQLIRIAMSQGDAARPAVPDFLNYIESQDASDSLKTAALQAVMSIDIFNPKVRTTVFAAAERGNQTALQLLGKYTIEDERGIRALVAAVESGIHAETAFQSLRTVKKRSSKLPLVAAVDRVETFEKCSIEDIAEALGRLQDLSRDVGSLRSSERILAQHQKLLAEGRELTDQQRKQHENQVALARERRSRSIEKLGTDQIPDVSKHLVRIIGTRPVTFLNQPAVMLLSSWRVPDDPETVRTLVEFGVQYGGTQIHSRALQFLPTSNPDSAIHVINGFRRACENTSPAGDNQQEILAGVLGRFKTAAAAARPLILTQLKTIPTPLRKGTRDQQRLMAFVGALGEFGSEFSSEEEEKETWRQLVSLMQNVSDPHILNAVIHATGTLGVPTDEEQRERYLAVLLKATETRTSFVRARCFSAFVGSHKWLTDTQHRQLSHAVARSLNAVLEDGTQEDWKMDFLTAPSIATDSAFRLADAMDDWTDDLKAILLKVARSRPRPRNYGPQKGFNRPQVDEAQKVLLNHGRRKREADE